MIHDFHLTQFLLTDDAWVCRLDLAPQKLKLHPKFRQLMQIEYCNFKNIKKKIFAIFWIWKTEKMLCISWLFLLLLKRAKFYFWLFLQWQYFFFLCSILGYLFVSSFIVLTTLLTFTEFCLQFTWDLSKKSLCNFQKGNWLLWNQT